MALPTMQKGIKCPTAASQDYYHKIQPKTRGYPDAKATKPEFKMHSLAAVFCIYE
jgi:hypothetical protein